MVMVMVVTCLKGAFCLHEQTLLFSFALSPALFTCTTSEQSKMMFAG